MFGLVVKSMLLRESLDKPYDGFNGSLYEEFSFMTKEEIEQGLSHGYKLWNKVMYINLILQRQNINEELTNEFEQANDFLLDKFDKLKEQGFKVPEYSSS